MSNLNLDGSENITLVAKTWKHRTEGCDMHMICIDLDNDHVSINFNDFEKAMRFCEKHNIRVEPI